MLCCVDGYQSLLTELFTGINNTINEHPDINLHENSGYFLRTNVWRQSARGRIQILSVLDPYRNHEP